MCLHSETENTESGGYAYYPVAVIDINTDGTDYCGFHAWYGDELNQESSGSDPIMAKLAWLSYRAWYNNAVVTSDVGIVVSDGFINYWMHAHSLVSNSLPSYRIEGYDMSNVYGWEPKANTYATTGKYVDDLNPDHRDDGKVIRARIILFSGGSLQETALLYGELIDPVPVDPDKYITEVDGTELTEDRCSIINRKEIEGEWTENTGKNLDPVKADFGETITFTIDIKNDTDKIAKNLTFEDEYEDCFELVTGGIEIQGTSWESGPTYGTRNHDGIHWNLITGKFDIPANETITVIIKLKVKEDFASLVEDKKYYNLTRINEGKWSYDCIKISKSDLKVDKYIKSTLRGEEVINEDLSEDRKNKPNDYNNPDSWKNINAVEVIQGDTVIFEIPIKNTGEGSGRNVHFEDRFDIDAFENGASNIRLSLSSNKPDREPTWTSTCTVDTFTYEDGKDYRRILGTINEIEADEIVTVTVTLKVKEEFEPVRDERYRNFARVNEGEWAYDAIIIVPIEIKIDKYITEIKIIPNAESGSEADTKNFGEERANKADDEKYEEPVDFEVNHAEITYNIKLENSSASPVKGYIYDVYHKSLHIENIQSEFGEWSEYSGLPAEQSMFDESVLEEDLKAIQFNDEIVLPANSKKAIILKMYIEDADEELMEELDSIGMKMLENRVFFKCRIVEQYQWIASSDFVLVKIEEPEIKINKYVIDVNEGGTVEDRSTWDEYQKLSRPENAGEENQKKTIVYQVEITYVQDEERPHTQAITGEFIDIPKRDELEITSTTSQTITLIPGETKIITVTAKIEASNALPGDYINEADFIYTYKGLTKKIISMDNVRINPRPTDESGNMHKYITKIEAPDGSAGNGSIIYESRSGLSLQQKINAPCEVEQGYIITYRIEVHNTVWYQNRDAFNGCSTCPSPCPYHYNDHTLVYLKCSDDFSTGLEFVSCNLHHGATAPDDQYGGDNYYTISGNHLEITWKHRDDSELRIDYNDTVTAEIKLKVTASNMQLASLTNKAYGIKYKYKWYNECQVAHHVWHWVVNPITGESILVCDHTACVYSCPIPLDIDGDLVGEDLDDVRLLDPIVEGHVWEDLDENGLRTDDESGINALANMPREDYKNIIVKLWKSDGTHVTNYGDPLLVATKTVDSNGHYSFGRVRKGNIKTGGEDSSKDAWYEVPLVQKFNYNSASLVTYYITFEYNGEKYEATKPVVDIGLMESAENYTIDSNAEEQDRDAFNKSLETISYNRAFGNTDGSGDGKRLAYQTSGSGLQVSTLMWDGTHLEDETSTDWASNYSSAAGANRSVTIIAKTNNFFFANSDIEYLKYIDLGIYRREDSANLAATKDVVSAEVTINGHKTTYDYNGLGTSPYIANQYNVLAEPYLLMIYREDYEFRTSYFINGSDTAVYEIVKANNPYTDMGRDNDLQVILTYKITVTNQSNSDSGLTAIVRELIDYYNKAEMELVEGTVRLDSENGAILQAYDSSQYKNKTYPSTYEAYTQKFFRGEALNNRTLEPGESLEVYAKYRVKKEKDNIAGEDENNAAIILDKYTDGIEDSKMNIAEIGAYSFYKDSKPAGLVDNNSNPGNIEFKSDGKADDRKFEDDTFETGIKLVLREDTETIIERKKYYYRNISGVVFEELDPTGNADGQLVGTGKKKDSDKWVPKALVKLYEVVQTTDAEGKPIEYYVDTGLSTRTDEEGRYNFDHDVHAGLYAVRFIYGDDANYFETTDGNTVRYSGQDYQSVKYTDLLRNENVEEKYIVNPPAEDEAKIFSAAAFAKVSGNNTHFSASGEPIYGTNIYSLAKDNEVRRLEVNEYSTTMTYPMDTVLKAGKNSVEAKLLAAHTAMYADTRTFDMDIEYLDHYDNITTKMIKIITETGIVKTTEIKNFYYSVRDINFGVIERPKTKLQLMKDITEIKATTSDGNTLIDIFFDITYEKEKDRDGNNTGYIAHTSSVNYAKSIGYKEVQVLNRDEINQGFRYANIDTELLQGMKITVKFRIAVANISEVDHLAGWLEEKMKTSTVDLNVSYGPISIPNPSTSTSGNNIIKDKINGQTRTYNYDKSYLYQLLYNGDASLGIGKLTEAHTGEYTYHPKRAAFTPTGPKAVRTRYTYYNIKRVQNTYQTGYYLGNVYYNATSSGTEAKVETRVDQYIDYVDNDLIFKPEENVNSNDQVMYLTYTTKDIAAKGLLRDINTSTTSISDGEKDYYNSQKTNINNNLAFNIEDANINPDFYKYLEPIEEETDINTHLYTMDLQASKILTSEMDMEGMIIDNIAEIVKVSNTAGRKVYVKVDSSVTGYLGNTTKAPIESVNDLTIPPEERETLVTISRRESDTDFTEYVTFSPPTGLTESQAVVKTIVTKAGDILLIVIPVIIIITGMTYVIVQMIRRKKFYK